MRFHRGLSAGFVAVFALCGASAAAAQDLSCRSGLGDTRVRGDLNVTSRCVLTGTEVRGDVTLFPGGSLIARNARIRGKLDARRGDFVTLVSTRIDGTVDLRELVGDRSSLERSDLRGNVVLAGNRSRLELLNNDLRRDLLLSGNTGGVLVSGNSIRGDLECAGNAPAPVGIGNRVDGDATGQCARLEPERRDDTPPPAPTTTPQPTTSRPPPTTSTPPPTTSAPPPTTSSPPPTTSAPPPTTASPPPTTSSPPPAATPAPPPAEPEEPLDDGGAGALDWVLGLLLLLGGRRLARRTTLR